MLQLLSPQTPLFCSPEAISLTWQRVRTQRTDIFLNPTIGSVLRAAFLHALWLKLHRKPKRTLKLRVFRHLEG
jgi:hypothetical protein